MQPKVTEFKAFQTRVFEPAGPTVPVGLDYDFNVIEAHKTQGEVQFPVYPIEAVLGKGDPLPFDVAQTEQEILAARNEAVQMREQMRMLRDEAKVAADAMRAEARQIFEATKTRAAEMIEKSRREIEGIEQKAYQAGFAQGEESGKTLGEQKIQSVVKNLSAVLENAGKEVEALLKASEADIAKAALELTLQLIHREIQQDPSVVLDMARAALSRVRNSSRLTFQVSSSDFSFMESHMDEFRTEAGVGVEIQVEVNPEIGRGGCRLLCDSGLVDATIETMVQNLLQQVMEEE